MTHLSPAELVDAAEGTLGPSRVPHLETCAVCRDELTGVTAALDAAREAGVRRIGAITEQRPEKAPR